MSVKSSTEIMLYVVLTMPTLNKAYLFIYLFIYLFMLLVIFWLTFYCCWFLAKLYGERGDNREILSARCESWKHWHCWWFSISHVNSVFLFGKELKHDIPMVSVLFGADNICYDRWRCGLFCFCHVIASFIMLKIMQWIFGLRILVELIKWFNDLMGLIYN
jgi:hypothetical protein